MITANEARRLVKGVYNINDNDKHLQKTLRRVEKAIRQAIQNGQCSVVICEANTHWWGWRQKVLLGSHVASILRTNGFSVTERNYESMRGFCGAGITDFLVKW